MAADVAPALQEEILTKLKGGLSEDKRLTRLFSQLANGNATYYDAHMVSQIVGEHTSNVLMQVLTPEILPDRRLYYNIAERTIKPAMELGDKVVGNYAEAMQTQMNRRAGMNIKAIKPRDNVTNINNICGLASDYEDFADGAWVLDKPVQTHTESFVDKFVKANAAFAAAAGLGPVIVRIAEPDCCPWCADLEGTYSYSEARAKGSDVYRRHNNCRCITEYYPGEGNRAQNVWNHSSWRGI